MSYKGNVVLFLILVLSLPLSAQTVHEVESPVDFVNPLMGSMSKYELSHGNVYPAIALPWGMNFWTPQTGKMGDGWQYQYTANKIRGFKQTHMPSPWMNDYGQFSIMPTTGSLKIHEDERGSWISHRLQTVKPYYYSGFLSDYDITTEITPTERAARFRMTFPEADSSWVIVDAFDNGSTIKVIPEEQKVIGYTTKNSGGVPENFRNYFILVFDKPFEISSVWSDGSIVENELELEEDHVGAAVGFKTFRGEQVNVKVASSFISHEQAERNLRELGDDDFDQVKANGRNIWNSELERIQVSGGTIDQTRTFYTTLWRTLLFPRKFYEYNEEGDIYHYSPYDGNVHSGYMYTDTGFWDTFRAVFPFLNLMHPSVNEKMQAGLVNAYLHSGFLPEWASPGHRNV
ncbi:MAG: GH92 family glycosyl hydrolase, partial [Balneolaceae bacterium]